MRRNPILVVFPYGKRNREPKISSHAKRRVRDQIRAQPKRLREIKSYDLRWQTVKGQFVRFYPGKNLRGVVVVPLAKGQRLSRAEYQQRARRRLSGRRSRMKRWMKQHATILRRLIALVRRYPKRAYFYTEYAKTLFEAFAEHRERAILLAGVATEFVQTLENLYVDLDEALGAQRKPSMWLPCAPFIYPQLKRFKLSPISWDEEVKLVVKKYKGVRPHELIRVYEGDEMAHPTGSANLFIYDKELTERDLDSYRANSFAMYAVCQLTKLQDEILDKDQRFTNSPALAKSPTPPLKRVQASPPGRFVLLACPIVIHRGPQTRDKTFREAHDYLMSVPPRKSEEQIQRRREAIRLSRLEKPRWEGELTKSNGERMIMSVEAKTEALARRALEDQMKVLNVSGQLTLKKIQRPSWWGPQFFAFSGQPVWMEIFQRFYWDKGLYVMPRLFLGYTPRGGYRERTAGQEAASQS